MRIDLNADLGEGAGSDAELMRLVTSANVNCGFYAGTPEIVRATLELAAARGVSIGAHPGHVDREHFGRREIECSERPLGTMVQYQIGALQALARLTRGELRYVKPHGGLYHQACREMAYARPVVAAALMNGLAVVGLPSSMIEAAARQVGVPFAAEGFLDRRYRPDGSLVPRGEANAFLDGPEEAVAQAEWLLREKGVRTLCVHGDRPGAVEFTAAVRKILLGRGHTLKAFA